MSETLSSNTLLQSAPKFLEEYEPARNEWHALSGLIDEMDGQDAGDLDERLEELKTALEESETVWDVARDYIQAHQDEYGKEQAVQMAGEIMSYGFTILGSCVEKMNEVHAYLSNALSEDASEQ